MTRFDSDTRRVSIVAITGLGVGTFQRALAAVRRIVPGFDILKINFDVDINKSNQAIYLRGEIVQAPITQLAASVVPGAVLTLTGTIYGARQGLAIPLRLDGEIIGALGFNSRDVLSDQQRMTCESYARQAELTLENARLRRILAGQPGSAELDAIPDAPAESNAAGVPETGDSRVITAGSLSLDPGAKSVMQDGSRVGLTPRGYALLEFFMRNPGRALAREQLALAVWGHPETESSNIIDVAVMHLRRKLETDGRPRLIHSVRGYGYIFEKR